jgi:outer membrane protein OmpA-like peptidoglycan-associated protein
MHCSTIFRHGAPTLLTVSVLAGALSACAHRPSEQLVDARSAYQDAESSPARERRPQELAAARVALDRAEQAHDSDPRSAREKRLASEAEYKARLARAHGEEAEAQHDANVAEREAAEARARAESAEQGRAVNETRAERAEERREAAEERREEAAEQRADDSARVSHHARSSGGEKAERAREKKSAAALQNLASVATVREEPRGVVITLSGALLFPSGQQELSPIARQNLDQVAHALSEQPPGTKFAVAGHTDNSGTSTQNKQLSLQRARAVADQLSAAGIDRDRVEVDGYGETRPIAGNDTPEGRASNRRVEIVVTPPTKTASR